MSQNAAGAELKPLSKVHRELAKTFYLENEKMNAAKRASEAARKELFKLLSEEGIEAGKLQIVGEDGKKVNLEVEVGSSKRTEQDVVKLRELLNNDDLFMLIVEASKKAVEEKAGKDVAIRCEVNKLGPVNVFVKVAK